MMPPVVGLLVGALVSATAVARDPFAPPAPAARRPDERTGLQRFEIGELRLVAVLHGERSRALLEDRVGIGYLAVLGTAIGPRDGVVIAVDRRALRIREPGVAAEIVLELRADDRDASP